MVSRRDLKYIHEEAVLSCFKAHIESGGSTLEILDRPDPPEAIVDLDGVRTWIEITDAFLDTPHAIGLTSGASDDVEHVPDSRRLIMSPDDTFSHVLHSVIASKCHKKSMRSIAVTHGPGILLVGVFTPFTTAEEVAHDEAADVVALLEGMPRQVFEIIYVYDGTGRISFHTLYRRTHGK